MADVQFDADTIVEEITAEIASRMDKVADVMIVALENAAPRRRPNIAIGIRTRVIRRKAGVQLEISLPFPAIAIEYGHLSRGKFVPPVPFIRRTLADKQLQILSILQGH